MLRNPRLRFLARASLLFCVTLSLWWLVLLGPLLGGLQGLVRWELGSSVSEIRSQPDGGWDLVSTRQTLPGKFADYAITPQTINLLTLGVPLYWALILAAPWSRETVWAWSWGTVTMLIWTDFTFFLTSMLILMLGDPFRQPGAFTYQLTVVLSMNRAILPFVVPVVMALAEHEGLRALIFPPADMGQVGNLRPIGNRPFASDQVRLRGGRRLK